MRELRPRPPLGLGNQWIGEEEKTLVLGVIQRGEPFRYYGHDPQNPPPLAAQLEHEFKEYCGARYALAVSSGTAALEVALGALGIGPGDEVIVPAWSWTSCFTSIVRMGARPVLAEIDETFCIAPGEITRLSTPATRAVMIVHYQGVVADMEPLLKEARQAGIAVIEDSAECAGASYRGRKAGAWGDIGIFSFQFQKTIVAGEGGLLVMNDARLFERSVRMHDLGQVRPYFHQFIEPQEKAFCGGQYRMTELQAAWALAQLRKLDAIREHCRALQQLIIEKIKDLPNLSMRRIPDPDGDLGMEIYLCFETAEDAVTFRDRLDALNVNCDKTTGTYCHYAREYCRRDAAHHLAASPFKDFETWPAPGYRAEDFPRTEDLVARFVAIPIGVLYTEEDADYIADCICRVLRFGNEE
jgi:8-amino-3,8-dideoxy-alpha-D-manno-octulosonate transaminase